MSIVAAPTDFYRHGGTLIPDAPCYVEREADEELLELVSTGEFCYVLAPRQTGKSSLMARTAAQLRGQAVSCAIIDLQFPRGRTADVFYPSLTRAFAQQLGLPDESLQWRRQQERMGPDQRFFDFIAEEALARVAGKVVVFVDEIDQTLGLDFSDDFFAGIRALYNARAHDRKLERISFVLLGVASPSELIKDSRHSPFNIGHRIELTDFTFGEARVLARGLSDDGEIAEGLLRRVLYWTGGHPYLTQRLCASVAEARHKGPDEGLIDDQVATLFFSGDEAWQDSNLDQVRRRMTEDTENSPALLALYARVRSGQPIADNPRSRVQAALRLSGVVKRSSQGLLVPRNEVYRRIFNLEWAREAQSSETLGPGAETHLQAWKGRVRSRMAGWLERMKQQGTGSVYSFLSTMTLLPVAQACRSGDWGALVALGQVLGGVGSALVANLIQKWDGDASVTGELEKLMRADPALRAELDAVLERLGTFEQAFQALREPERAWFVSALRDELRQLGNEARFVPFFQSLAGPAGMKLSAATSGGSSIAHIVDQYVRASHQHRDEAHLHRSVMEYVKWLRDSLGSLELRGIKREGQQVLQLDLAAAHVPLEGIPSASATEGCRVDLSQILAEQVPLISEPNSDQCSSALTGGRRIVVTGGPGCGKTTLMQHIAWALATAIAADDPDIAREKLGLHGRPPLPIFVPLSAYAQYRASLRQSGRESDRSLLAFITQYLAREGGFGLPSDFLETLLGTDSSPVLLLDGLDEVPDERDRLAVREAVEDLVTGRDALRVVVTCRTPAYQGSTVLGRGFAEVRIPPLQEAHIERLVRRAYAAIYPHEHRAAQARADDLMRGIRNLERERRERLGEGVQWLFSSPLLVQMALTVHFSERRLPEHRGELYMRAIDAMLLPEYVPDEAVADRVGRHVGTSREVHRELVQHIAFAMHNRGPTQGREITENDLRALLAQNSTYASLADDFIALTRLRSTLLEERTGAYRFIHHDFQEYLAARYLGEIVRGEKGIDGIVSFLQQGPILESWWREPSLLLAGYLTVTSPQTGCMFMRKLSGAESRDREAPVACALDVQLASAEIAGMAVVDWQGAPHDLRAELANRLCQLFRDTQVMTHTKAPLRATTGATMGLLGDRRFCTDAWHLLDAGLMGFVEIPTGPSLMGSDKEEDRLTYDEERPQHEIQLPSYYMARYPVTVAQFKAFELDCGTHREGPYSVHAVPNHPVVLVTWHDAMAYCEWLTDKLRELATERLRERQGAEASEAGFWQGLLDGQLRVTLPSEAEWEKAARGTDGRQFPWGDEPDPDRANCQDTGIGGTSAVGCFPSGASTYGCLDMAGNVWEWTRSLWGANRKRPDFTYPYDPADGRECLEAPQDALRVVRGGTFLGDHRYVRCAFRGKMQADRKSPSAGFRIAVCHCQAVTSDG